MKLPDLCEQQTTTTGTGTYTVSGSVTERRTFLTALGGGTAEIPYTVIYGNEFECGYGTWDGSAGTVTRAVIVASSNANAAVNWGAGTKHILVAAHSGSLGLSAVRNGHFGLAGGVPGVNDDTTKGYRIGSLWPGSGKCYIATDVTTGAAVWKEFVIVNPGTGWGSTGLYQWDETFNQSAIAIDGGIAWGNHGLQFNTAITADATPEEMGIGNVTGSSLRFYCDPGSAITVDAIVVAHDRGSNDTKSWDLSFTGNTTSDGVTTALVDAVTKAVRHDTAGAATWDIDVVADSASNTFYIEVTGAAATDIVWGAQSRMIQAGSI